MAIAMAVAPAKVVWRVDPKVDVVLATKDVVMGAVDVVDAVVDAVIEVSARAERHNVTVLTRKASL